MLYLTGLLLEMNLQTYMLVVKSLLQLKIDFRQYLFSVKRFLAYNPRMPEEHKYSSHLFSCVLGVGSFWPQPCYTSCQSLVKVLLWLEPSWRLNFSPTWFFALASSWSTWSRSWSTSFWAIRTIRRISTEMSLSEGQEMKNVQIPKLLLTLM